MINKYTILAAICGAVTLVGAAECTWQFYHMVTADAKARGLAHPKFWGLFAISANNSSGLIMYLIGRRKYPLLDMSDSTKNEMDRRKKAVGAGLFFLAAGSIGLICSLYFYQLPL